MLFEHPPKTDQQMLEVLQVLEEAVGVEGPQPLQTLDPRD
jgi:hypothetical protein